MATSCIRSGWYFEETSVCEGHGHAVVNVIVRKKTNYQSVEIFESKGCGRCLILDDRMQSTEADDFIYHESLVHPAMLVTAVEPRVVLIIGGGEGATLREVLKYRSIEKAVMVDIDSEVVSLCREHLPSMSNGSFEDPRVELLHEDAYEFLQNTDLMFDVIICDLTEPIPTGPAARLYSLEFMKIIREKLSYKGVFAMQAGIAKHNEIDVFATALFDLRKVYAKPLPYQAFVPCFGTPLGFVLALKDDNCDIETIDMNHRIAQRINGEIKYWDAETQRHSFNIPKNIRRLLGIS